MGPHRLDAARGDCEPAPRRPQRPELPYRRDAPRQRATSNGWLLGGLFSLELLLIELSVVRGVRFNALLNDLPIALTVFTVLGFAAILATLAAPPRLRA